MDNKDSERDLRRCAGDENCDGCAFEDAHGGPTGNCLDELLLDAADELTDLRRRAENNQVCYVSEAAECERLRIELAAIKADIEAGRLVRMTMSDLISRKVLESYFRESGERVSQGTVISLINSVPTVDAVSVIRGRLEEAAFAPEIVCLCGSMRFCDTFRKVEYELELQGKIVLAPIFKPGVTEHGGTIGCTPAQKEMLDDLHKRKIYISDRVLVLNVGGYIGESTRSEIAYALSLSKPVDYLEGGPQ